LNKETDMLRIFALAGLVLSLGTAAAPAQESGLPDICKAGAAPMQMGGGASMAMPADDAHKALMAGMWAMDKDMNQGMGATDIDVAFICGMIPHHQGAIDMAKVELQYGKDPKLRALAEAIIKAQEEEIAEMKAWQQAHP